MSRLAGIVFLALVVLLVFPFLIASVLVDEQGIPLAGHVTSKDEYISVDYYSWTRHLDATVQYERPEDRGTGFLVIHPQIDQFDTLKKNDVVQLHYLLAKDLPDLPRFKIMRQMRVLPMVRLATDHIWTGAAQAFEQHRSAATGLLFIALLLAVWRILRLPFFTWLLIACILVGGAVSMIASFPTPTRAPSQDVRSAHGTIKSLETWSVLFRNNRSRGVEAAQPIVVAAVQFVPEGRAEPVVAVDLIDEGSLPGLAEHSPVTVDYENGSPRVAHIQKATRDFAHSNLVGLAWQLFALLAVGAVGLVVFKGFGLFYRTLTGQRGR